MASLLLGAVALLPAQRAQAFNATANVSCEEGVYMRWHGGPTTWYMNEKGYSGIEFDTLLSILQEGADLWSAPCCSGFKSRYMGITSQGARFPPEKNVLLFEEDEAKWPKELGARGAVIATTFRRGTPWCSIDSAFMIFNGIDRTFVEPDAEMGKTDTDLLSIVVHEFGHWLGLDHTDEAGAIMRPSYTYGTKFNGLADDDIAGVCAVYPGSCEVCGSDDDCPSESICVEGGCTLLECSITQHCAMGTICRDSSCVPGCRAHAECGEEGACVDGACVERGPGCEKHVDCSDGESCVNGRCGVQPSACSICAVCTFDSDCGMDGICMSTDVGGRCTKPCESDRECAGDSVCRNPGSDPSKFCLNPTSNPYVICPSSYECTVPEPGPTLGCALLGQACTGGSLGCGGRSDTCYDGVSGPECSCTCNSDDECGPGARCLADPSSGDLPSCFLEESIVECGDGACAPGQRCGEGGCEPDPCFGTSCGEGEVCVEGSCTRVKEPVLKPRASKGGCASAGSGGGAPLLALVLAAASLRRRKENRNKNLG